MAQITAIEWADSTWNPLTGCTKVSPGCQHCYAERMARRLHSMGQARYQNGFELTLHPDALELPLRWQKPQVIFVNSMSDLFHQSVPDEYIAAVFDVMARAHWHTFQMLTKRSHRLAEIGGELPWRPNVWMGVSIESSDWLRRADDLRSTPALVKFLSLEPLLAPLPDLRLDGIHWVIAGGESGPAARPAELDWLRQIRDLCLEGGVPFFLKQLGGVRDKRSGERAKLDGRLWTERPRLRHEAATDGAAIRADGGGPRQN